MFNASDLRALLFIPLSFAIAFYGIGVLELTQAIQAVSTHLRSSYPFNHSEC